MIVVRNGKVFKYSQKVIKYQHQHLNSIKYWYKLQYLEKYLNTVAEVFVTTVSADRPTGVQTEHTT